MWGGPKQTHAENHHYTYKPVYIGVKMAFFIALISISLLWVTCAESLAQAPTVSADPEVRQSASADITASKAAVLLEQRTDDRFVIYRSRGKVRSETLYPLVDAFTLEPSTAPDGGPTGTASAQSVSGFYLSQEIGFNRAPSVELFGNSNDRASHCDEFINPRFAEVPGCTDPDRGSGAGWKTAYDRAAGILAGLSVGYRVGGGRLRVEAEWFHRESEYDQTSPVASATGDTFAKLDGEIQRAEDRIGNISSQNIFANVYVDFPSGSRLTPYVGGGVGIVLTELDYGDLWARNPDPDAISTAAGLPNEAEIRRNLAATTTSKQAELHDRQIGYQVLGGVDYAASDTVSLGVKVRWVRFGRFTAKDIEWERLRSHASQLRLDGSEPVTFRIRTGDDLSFVGINLAMRYAF